MERERLDLGRATLRSVLFTTLARLRTALRERYGRPDPESPVTRMARSMATRWADTVATYVPPDHPAARRAH